jgi:hypothetical protein
LSSLANRGARHRLSGFFSATHGLQYDKHKRWKGRISDGKVRVRFAFITERALNADEANALTNIARVQLPQIDPCISRRVQPNYIKRPHWVEHPERDPLGGIPTIGWVKGKHEYLAIPDNLTHVARWAKAQGHGATVAEHPDATTAVGSVGANARVREHLMSAVVHLLNANPIPEVTSFADHAAAIADQLQSMLERYREEITANLAQHHRPWSDVLQYDDMVRWAQWLLDHPGALRRKTIKLIKDDKPRKKTKGVTLEAIYARVLRAIARTCRRAHKATKPECNDPKLLWGVELVAAPTGSRKSTLMRRLAVAFVTAHPDKSVVILMPRHKLGDEQIDLLMKEHPNGSYTAAVWRGRQAWDPEIGDGQEEKMCQRAEEAEELEKALLDVERNLCKKGRGKKKVKCPLFDVCGYQRQKQIEANIWFAAHECMVHKKPKAFGDIGLLLIDESPLDAFMFGVDNNDPVELPLDKLRDRIANNEALTAARRALYQILDALPKDRGVAKQVLKDTTFTYEILYEEVGPDNKVLPGGGKSFLKQETSSFHAKIHHREEWSRKVKPDIRPNMTKAQVRKELEKAAGNAEVKARATLWKLVGLARWPEAPEQCGRIQVHDSKSGRIISMVGLHDIAKGWSVPTLICDATGDAELLRPIWPMLTVEEEPWPQLPRPESVRVFQIVDRSISKWAVAVEGKNKKELERKAAAARQMYAALLLKALEYGGAEVGAIVYKSTEEWIRENCFVPGWLKLSHHGDITGTNAFENVAALFEIGRIQPPPEAMACQAEALFGNFISKREYSKTKARIPIVPDRAGHTSIEVELYQHRNLMVRRLLWQAREGACIQAEGRARAGLRDSTTPLDIHRWTDLPLPELGPVEPVLWSEVDARLEGLMLATGGVWLECVPDAAKAYPDLFTVSGLESARKSSGGVSLIGILISKTPPLTLIRYQRRVPRVRPVRAVTLLDLDATRAWLEERLGPLARFEVEDTRFSPLEHSQ